MKSNLLLGLLYSFMFFTAHGQIIENFAEAKLVTSYGTGNFTGTNEIVWNYVNARGGQTTTANANNAISLNKAANACLFSDTLRYGLVSLAFQYEQELTTNCNASVWINDSCIAQLKTTSQADITQYFAISGLSFKGNVVISIRQNAANSGQLTIDDIALVYAEKPLTPFSIVSLEHHNQSSHIVCSHYLANCSVQTTPFPIVDSVSIHDSSVTIFYKENLCGEFELCITNLQDTLSRNHVDTCMKREFQYIPQRHDIVITEIMADPSPSIGLPEYEYIELYNTSLCPIYLSTMQLLVGHDSYNLPNILVYPESYIMLVTEKAKYLYSDTIAIAGMQVFPALLNTGQTIALVRDSIVLDGVSFSDSWYKSKIKKDGGWALEKIDIHNLSETEQNWSAAQNFLGGTPGFANSVTAHVPDVEPPYVEYITVLNDSVLLCKTNEWVDSEQLRMAIECNNGIEISHCNHRGTHMHEYELLLHIPLEKRTVYSCSITPSLIDFAGNRAVDHEFEIALFDTVEYRNEISITELLFNPIPGTYDFVELYNNSEKFINLEQLILANRDSISNDVGTFVRIASRPTLFAPHSYAVISADATYYKTMHACNTEGLFVTLSNMPSFPDTQGSVIIQNIWGTTIDSLTYSETWHSKHLKKFEGVSLERLDLLKPTPHSSNWKSASTLANSMSPGCPNTQQASCESILVQVEKAYIRPNTDGNADELILSYTADAADKTAHMYIFSFEGELVRHAVNNKLMGTQGVLSWDGTSSNQELVPPGIYIVYVEILEQGSRVFHKKFSCTVVY